MQHFCFLFGEGGGPYSIPKKRLRRGIFNVPTFKLPRLMPQKVFCRGIWGFPKWGGYLNGVRIIRESHYLGPIFVNPICMSGLDSREPSHCLNPTP